MLATTSASGCSLQFPQWVDGARSTDAELFPSGTIPQAPRYLSAFMFLMHSDVLLYLCIRTRVQ
eukprot:COSAG02_NODE_9_length_59728_cov_36.104714_60_plen_64_part_00